MKLFYVFLAIVFLSMHPSLLQAQSITPTPEKSLDEIQKIREAVQQKVKEKLQEITRSSSTKKAFVGKVIQVDSSQVTIEALTLDTRIIKLSSELIIVDSKRNKTKLENLKIGQDILAMGDIDEQGTLTAKRIVFIDLKTLNSNQLVVAGKIVDISKTSSIISLIPSKNKNTQYQIKLDSKTIITDSFGQKIASTTIKSGHKTIVILTPDPKATKTYIALRLVDYDYTPSPTPTK